MCCQQGLSIACSTPEALAWDPDWEGSHEISGRAMRTVHTAGEHFTYQKRCGTSSACSGSGPRAQPCANGSGAATATQAPEQAPGKRGVAPERSPLPTVAHAKAQEQQQQQQKAGGPHLLPNGTASTAQANGMRISAR